MQAALALLVAFGLDRWLGEPRPRWHPVVWMGHYLGWIGSRIAPHQASIGANWRIFWAGALAWYGGAALVLLAAILLQMVLSQFPLLLAGLALGLLLKPMLAWAMLRSEVLAVEAALGESLDAGRRRLGWLVSREVMHLNESEVRESAIESLAENLNDSVVAPVFWFVVAGLPGAALYRFANTADAMWGYRGMRAGIEWEWAGKWAARADDALSWIPARLTALLIGVVVGGLPLGRLRRDAAVTPSPNSGWPMAAMALALDVRLRKPGVYALNADGAAPTAAHTARAIALCHRAIGLLLALALLVLLAVSRESRELPW